MRFGLIGAAIAAVCCVTALLPFTLGAIGLSGLIAYLYTDLVLYLALAVCLCIAGVGYWLIRRSP
jgi:mercuric ion transport protein